jgi:hypothetical protein
MKLGQEAAANCAVLRNVRHSRLFKNLLFVWITTGMAPS